MKTPDQIIDEALGIVDPVRTAISENKITVDTTGSGLYDKSVIQTLKSLNDPYPYLRGLVSVQICPKIIYLRLIRSYFG